MAPPSELPGHTNERCFLSNRAMALDTIDFDGAVAPVNFPVPWLSWANGNLLHCMPFRDDCPQVALLCRTVGSSKRFAFRPCPANFLVDRD